MKSWLVTPKTDTNASCDWVCGENPLTFPVNEVNCSVLFAQRHCKRDQTSEIPLTNMTVKPKPKSREFNWRKKKKKKRDHSLVTPLTAVQDHRVVWGLLDGWQTSRWWWPRRHPYPWGRWWESLGRTAESHPARESAAVSGPPEPAWSFCSEPAEKQKTINVIGLKF